MVELTERTRRLLQLINQLSQNTTQNLLPQNSLTNSNVDVTLPSLELDFGLDLGGISVGGGSGDGGGDPGTPGTPSTIRELLQTLVGSPIEVTVPFGTVSGTLLAVRNDYIVLVDGTEQVLVPIGQIEIVNEL